MERVMQDTTKNWNIRSPYTYQKLTRCNISSTFKFANQQQEAILPNLS